MDLAAIERGLLFRADPARYARHVRRLASFASGRFAGSAGNRAARAYLLSAFRKAGLSRVGIDPFPYRGWTRGARHATSVAILDGAEGGGGEALPAIALPGSPPVRALEAEAVWVGEGSLARFAQVGRRLKGRFAVVTSQPVARGRDLHRNERFCRAAAAGAAGFLYARHFPGNVEETGSVGWSRGGLTGALPAAALSYESGERLRAALAREPGLRLRLSVGCRLKSAWGGIPRGDLPGRPGAKEILIVGGHFDGHDLAQAAVDNGTGTALVLTLAELFAPLAGTLPCAIRFLGFDAEELGLIGSKACARRLERTGEIGRVRCVANFDMPLGKRAQRVVTNGRPGLARLLAPVAKGQGDALRFQQGVSTASDHWPFVAAGVPAIAVYGTGEPKGLGRGIAHTRLDTLSEVPWGRMRPVLRDAARIVLRLAAADPFPERRWTRSETRRAIPRGVKVALQAQKEWEPF